MNGDQAALAAALARHLTVGGAARDAKWRHRFYDLIVDVRLCERDPRITTWDDGFPYYTLDVPGHGGSPGTRVRSTVGSAPRRSG